MIQTRRTPYRIASFACCILAAILFTSRALATDLRLGIIGTDTSHVVEFTKILNDASNPDHVPGARVVAAFKGGSPDIPSSRDRVENFAAELQKTWHIQFEGYFRAMTERSLMPRSVGFDLEQPGEVGYLAVKSILSQGGPVSAIVAGSDATAQGVYAALRECGLRVPEDISVTGFDDIEAGALHPHLTTGHIFLEEIGKQLAEFLLRRIDQHNLPSQKSIIPTRLVKGESTAPTPSLQADIKNWSSTLESGACLTGELCR